MKNSYQKFTKDVISIGATNLLLVLSTLIVIPLLTKTLGAHYFGIWSQAEVTIQLVLYIVGLGLPFALSRFLAAETNREKLQEGFYSAFTVVTLATLAASILLIVFANPLATAFFDGAIQIVRITGLIILVWSLDMMFLNLFRARRQMISYGIFMIAARYGEIGLIAYFVFNGHGILSVILCLLAVRALLLLILFLFIKSQIGIKRPHFYDIKEYLSFGLPTVPGDISAWIIASSDRYIIAYFLGTTSVGIYSAAYALGTIPLIFAAVLGIVLAPTLSKLYDEGRMSEVKIYLSYSLKYFLALAIPFVFGAAILGKPVLGLFSTVEIASQGYFVVPMVALGVLLYGAFAVIYHTLVLVKKTRILGVIWIIAALVNLGLNIMVVPYLGIMGEALACLIAYSLVLGMGSYYSFRELTFDIDWRFIIKSLIASAIMALVIWIISNLNVIITVLVGVAVYGVGLFLLKGFKREEIAFFSRLFSKNVPAASSDNKTE